MNYYMELKRTRNGFISASEFAKAAAWHVRKFPDLHENNPPVLNAIYHPENGLKVLRPELFEREADGIAMLALAIEKIRKKKAK